MSTTQHHRKSTTTTRKRNAERMYLIEQDTIVHLLNKEKHKTRALHEATRRRLTIAEADLDSAIPFDQWFFDTMAEYSGEAPPPPE